MPVASITEGQAARLRAVSSFTPEDFLGMLGDRDVEQCLRALESDAAETRCLAEVWPEPEDVLARSPLHPVPSFEFDLLPAALRPWIEDIAERVQCPPDFLAVGAIVALSSVLGRQLGIRPDLRNDWTVAANLWAMVVGRPGIMKTPALKEVLRPIVRFEIEAKEGHDLAMREFTAAQHVAEARAKRAKSDISKAVNAGNDTEAGRLAMALEEDAPKPPPRTRFKVNDCTIEKLGEILADNPNGVLWFRDELAGLFNMLERSGHETDRQFILEAWDGLGSFTFDRIGRGTIHIPANCLSILGGIQPGALAKHVADATTPGKGADGLLQRFQLAVWPDPAQEWRHVDRWPDSMAKSTAWSVFERFRCIDANGMEREEDGIPFVRFTPDACVLFNQWRGQIERRLRSGELTEAIEGHLSKYRSLVPSIALILHLADNPPGPVGTETLGKAIRWSRYLFEHALRIYGGAVGAGMDGAQRIAREIMAGKLPEPFRAREINRRKWSGLTEESEVLRALVELEQAGWLRSIKQEGTGRPTTDYHIHPRILYTPWERTAKTDETPPNGTNGTPSGSFGSACRECPAEIGPLPDDSTDGTDTAEEEVF